MTTLLEAVDVAKKYENFTALAGISFKVEANEIIAIVGPNGAGKSTLVDTLTGLLRPSSGHVQYNGVSLSSLPPSEWATRGLVRSFQLVAIFPTLSVAEMIALGVLSRMGRSFDPFRSLAPDEAVWKIVMQVAAMTGLQQRLRMTCRSLSQGEKKLVDIASAIALEPKVFLMDEPTSGVSSGDKHAIMQTLLTAAKNQGVLSILLVEHDMDLIAEYSTRVIALQAGKIVADMLPKQFFADQRFLASIVGVVPAHA